MIFKFNLQLKQHNCNKKDTYTQLWDIKLNIWRECVPMYYSLFNNYCKLFWIIYFQYGFNRISQVCETHTAGYDFVVLNNAFLIHHGFKTRDGFHSAKDEENNRNRDLFRTFKKELKSKYPQSTSHCWQTMYHLNWLTWKYQIFIRTLNSFYLIERKERFFLAGYEWEHNSLTDMLHDFP